MIFDEIKPCILKYSSKGFKEKREKDIKINGHYDESNVYNLIDNHYLVTKSKNVKASGKIFEKDYEIIKFDRDKKIMWRHKDDSLDVKNMNYNIYLLHSDTSSIFYMKMNYQKSKFMSVDFISINTKTGEKLNTMNHNLYKEET